MKKPEVILVVVPNTALYPFIVDFVRTHMDNLAQQGGFVGTIQIIMLSIVWMMWKGTTIYLIGQILTEHIFKKPAQRRFK